MEQDLKRNNPKRKTHKMENRPLVTQFRLSFARIVIASILATVVTYILAAVLYSRATFRVIYPANYYEQQIPELDAYIREKNTALLSRSGEKGLQSVIHGDGMSYQVLNKDGSRIYGTNHKNVFKNKQELFSRLNTTFRHGGRYTHVVPIVDPNGKIQGAVTLSYRLRMSYIGNSGRLVNAVLMAAIFSPFLYIIGFTVLYSRMFVRNIHHPLQILMDASRKIREKNLDFEINYHADNELGKLCGAFTEMQEELKKSLSAQWKMEQERVEMVEALAHDLKTPLSIIKGYTEALMDSGRYDEEKYHRYLAVIHENAEKGTALVQQMQYTSDLQNSGAALQPVPVNLAGFLEQKVLHYALQARQKGITIGWEIQGDVPAPLRTDTDKLGRILDNILSNSMEHTPVGGKIHILVKAEKERISYRICDTGGGFRPEDLEKAFNRFYRGDEARSSKDGHSGLGLYIARQLVEQLGGSIRIENAESGGACVLFWHKSVL